MPGDSVTPTNAAENRHQYVDGVPTEERKVYQDWPGRQKFYKDGKFVMQWSWVGAVRTIVILLGLEGLFLGLVGRRLDTPLDIIAMTTSAALVLAAIGFLLQTLLTDPGMLPKLEPSEAYLRMQLPRHKDVRIGESHVTIRYDDTYHIYRPPRAHHCRVLNVVIARFDHFCPWTGTAIGLRNYRPFVLFLLSCTLSAIHGIAFSVLHIVHHMRGDGKESEPDPGGIQSAQVPDEEEGGKSRAATLFEVFPSPLMVVILAAFLLPVGGLLCFHLYLIARGMTTYEAVGGAGAIYSQGLCKNCWNVWFAPTPPPFVDFRQPTRTANGQQPPDIVAKYNPQHGGSSAGATQQYSPMHRQHQVPEIMGDQNC